MQIKEVGAIYVGSEIWDRGMETREKVESISIS